MKTIRIFISSPGDVAEERERARQVVESLRRRYVGRLNLEAVLWENLPLQADASFQEGIDTVLSADHGVDIAVFILWSRLGSPLGMRVLKEDGSGYRSGTEREFDLMLAARKQSGGERPLFLVYTRKDEATFEERLRGTTTDAKQQMIEQKRQVESFIAEEFHDRDSGHNLRAYHTFDRPTTFSQRLRVHLQGLLDEEAGEGGADALWDIERQGPPFMGLEAFGSAQAAIFCGRENETLEAHRALAEAARSGCAFLLLSGASGSGKSSLARAGVLPSVAQGEIDETVSQWHWLTVTPSELGADPLAALVLRLCEPGVLPELRSESLPPAVLAEALRRDAALTVDLRVREAFAQATRKRKGGVRLVLLVDQFEELFSMAKLDGERRREFLAVLEALARCGQVWVVATVRSDFLGTLQEDPASARLMGEGKLFPLAAPDTDALRRIIEEPARLAGLRFEEKEGRLLSDGILADAARHHDPLPLLEYVLRELFDQRTPDHRLQWSAYEALGGVEGALAQRAESVFSRLPQEVGAALPQVLKSLVGVVEVGANGEERFVRQRVAQDHFTGGSPAGMLVEALVCERLLTASEEGGVATVAVAHEALLRVWPRAAAWAEGNRELLRTRARVASRMNEGGLLPEGDPLLAVALRHRKEDPEAFSPEQHGFLERSEAAVAAARGRRARLRRRVLVGLSTLTALALAGGGLAWVQRQHSMKEQYYSSMAAANAAVNGGEVLDAFRELVTAPEAHRNWEWRYLAQRIGFVPLRVPASHVALLDEGALKGSGLREIAEQLIRGEEPMERDTESDYWRYRRGDVGIDMMRGTRSGGGVAVGRRVGKVWTNSAVHLTAAYGTALGGWISQDRSLVMWWGGRLRDTVLDSALVSGLEVPEEELAIYLLPVPQRYEVDRIFDAREIEREGGGEDINRTAAVFSFSATISRHEAGEGEEAGEKSVNLLIRSGGEGAAELIPIPEEAPYDPKDEFVLRSLDPKGRERLAAWLDEPPGDPKERQPKAGRTILAISPTKGAKEVIVRQADGAVEAWDLAELRLIRSLGINGGAQMIWRLPLNWRDQGAAYSADGKWLVLCPYQDENAAVFSTEDWKVQSQLFDSYARANDWSARPTGRAHWGMSPKGTFAWMSGFDGPAKRTLFGLHRAQNGEVVESGANTTDFSAWTANEGLYAAYSYFNGSLSVKNRPNGKVLGSFQLSNPPGPGLISENPAFPERLMIADRLFIQPGLEPLMRFNADALWVSGDLDTVVLLRKNELEIVSGLASGKEPASTLASRVFELEKALLEPSSARAISRRIAASPLYKRERLNALLDHITWHSTQADLAAITALYPEGDEVWKGFALPAGNENTTDNQQRARYFLRNLIWKTAPAPGEEEQIFSRFYPGFRQMELFHLADDFFALWMAAQPGGLKDPERYPLAMAALADAREGRPIPAPTEKWPINSFQQNPAVYGFIKACDAARAGDRERFEHWLAVMMRVLEEDYDMQAYHWFRQALHTRKLTPEAMPFWVSTLPPEMPEAFCRAIAELPEGFSARKTILRFVEQAIRDEKMADGIAVRDLIRFLPGLEVYAGQPDEERRVRVSVEEALRKGRPDALQWLARSIRLSTDEALFSRLFGPSPEDRALITRWKDLMLQSEEGDRQVEGQWLEEQLNKTE